MKKKKLKEKYVSEDVSEVRNLIIITIIIIAIAAGLYLFTEKVINKKEDTTNNVEFNYDECTLGMAFNRPYDNYYLFIYNSEESNSSTYKSLITSYKEKEEHKKIYFIDLKNSMNKSAISDKSNTNPKTVDEIAVKDSALIEIKNKKVVKYYETLTDYQKVLK